MSKINHNPQNLKVGEVVMLDADFNNPSSVTIVDFTPSGMFAVVRSNEVEWEVMTSRLTRISHD